MRWIREDHYAESMKSEVLPYINARKRTGFFERVPGERIYFERFTADSPKAAVVISHGFTESIQKYYEAIWYFLQAGFSVWGADHRGHGKSFRQNANPYVVFVTDFEDYVRDLKFFTESKVIPASGKLPVYLYCHSMGGCIGARLIETDPTLFRKAVLSSPMLGLDFGKVPVPVVYAGAKLKSLVGSASQPLHPVVSYREESFEQSCDSSRCRFDWYASLRRDRKELQTVSASLGWGMEAAKACGQAVSRKWTAKIQIPVLLFQAGNDTVVKNASQDLFASRVKTCTLARIPGMKHELFMTDSEVQIPYWEKIFSFFNEARA